MLSEKRLDRKAITLQKYNKKPNHKTRNDTATGLSERHRRLPPNLEAAADGFMTLCLELVVYADVQAV